MKLRAIANGNERDFTDEEAKVLLATKIYEEVDDEDDDDEDTDPPETDESGDSGETDKPAENKPAKTGRGKYKRRDMRPEE